MSDSESDFGDLIPPELLLEAKGVTEDLLPEKSKTKYTAVYNEFKSWRKTKKTSSFDEAILLIYFKELAETMKPSTLWARYSMLRLTIKVYNKVDISIYGSLNAFLKKKASGFKSKKSKVFSPEEVKKFFTEAPDSEYLATKVACAFGITGACRRQELCNMTTSDIEDRGNMIVVKIPETKTNIQRSFTVIDEFYNIYKKYAALRPVNTKGNRFFLNYRNGKCTQQFIGINKFGGMPKQIATFLNLQDPQLYTGHSFRRTSATLLADSGADIMTLKRHGGWASDRVAEGYIEESVGSKTKICKQITGSIMSTASASTKNPDLVTPGTKQPLKAHDVNTASSTLKRSSSSATDEENPKYPKIVTVDKDVSLQFNNCTNFTINYVQKENK